MARIATTEDVDGLRDEEDFKKEIVEASEDSMEEDGAERERSPTPKPTQRRTGKYVATSQEVHDAFDTVNVLRYSQPCHLQGLHSFKVMAATLTLA